MPDTQTIIATQEIRGMKSLVQRSKPSPGAIRRPPGGAVIFILVLFDFWKCTVLKENKKNASKSCQQLLFLKVRCNRQSDGKYLLDLDWISSGQECYHKLSYPQTRAFQKRLVIII